MIIDNVPTNSHHQMIEGGDTSRKRVEYRSLSVEIHSHLKTGQQWTVGPFHRKACIATLATLLFNLHGHEPSRSVAQPGSLMLV